MPLHFGQCCSAIDSEGMNKAVCVGWTVLTLDGKEARDLEAFYSLAETVFQFPAYFGHNLDALDECLSEPFVDDQGKYLLVFKNHRQFLRDCEPDKAEAVFEMIAAMPGEWGNCSVPLQIRLYKE